jgi:hypothetical protein
VQLDRVRSHTRLPVREVEERDSGQTSPRTRPQRAASSGDLRPPHGQRAAVAAGGTPRRARGADGAMRADFGAADLDRLIWLNA